METRKLKDKAGEAFAKGRFSKAAELYEEYCATDPKDLQARLRMGDAFARSGSRDKAIKAYQRAAEDFAQGGFLPRAIAASKLILELDPAHKGVQTMLAELYARRGIGGPGARQAPIKEPKAPISPAGRHDAIELPPDEGGMELESGSAPLAAGSSAGSNDGLELEAEGLEIEIDVDEAPAAPAAPAAFKSAVLAGATSSAPPGLRPKRAPQASVAPATPTLAVTPASSSARNAEDPGAVPRFDELELEMAPAGATALPMLSFTELEMEGASLLHAVELAAEAGRARDVGPRPAAAPEPIQAEEIVFSVEDLAEPAHPQALPKIPLFSDLAPEAFIALFERCPLRRFDLGATIIQQGSQGDSFFVICAGSVRVFRQEEGERKELAILPEGAFFGEVALLSDAPRTASVESASDDTQLLEISAPVLAELSHRYPPVAQALKKFCRQRLLQNVMSTSALFRPFNRKDRKQLVERFRARDVQRGAVLIREGDRTDGLYVLLSGEVEVRKGAQVLARLKEGEIFGEMSLLQKTPATATVVATKRTSLLRLPREDFDELILSHPQILILISELTEDRRRQTEAVLGGAAMHSGDGLLLV